MVIDIGRIAIDVVDDNLMVKLSDLITQRAFDLQLVAWRESEGYLVDGSARHPARLRHARDGGKPHVGRQHDRFQQYRDSRATADRIDIILEIVPHN